MNLFSLALAVILPIQPYLPLAEIRPPAPTQQLTGQIVFSNTIENELSRFLVDPCRLVVMDNTFGCLPEERVLEITKKFLFTFDNSYVVEARDCDDLALEAIVKLRRLFRDETEGVPFAAPVGLVGIKIVSDIPDMRYLLEGRVGYHAAVVVRCAGGKYLLIDPGTKKVSEFTQYIYEGSIELLLGIF